jgi:DNA-binding XRE family transcriptional regulator
VSTLPENDPETGEAPTKPLRLDLPPGLLRRRPRSYAKWRWLRQSGRMPAWESLPAGFLLREAREAAGLTQRELAERLGCSQQAVARAERWESNPTVGLVERWAAATGRRVVLELRAEEQLAARPGNLLARHCPR